MPLSAIKQAAQVVGGLGKMKTWETFFPSIFHPEQIMRESSETRQLYEMVNRLAHDVRMEERPYHEIVKNLFKKHGLVTDRAKANFFTLLEWPAYMKRPPTPDEIRQFSPNVRGAVVDHLRNVTDPIWTAAKRADPKVGYTPGYFTHYAPSIKRVLEDESERIVGQLRDLKRIDDPAAADTIGSLEAQLEHLKSRLTKFSHVTKDSHIDEILAPQRYGLIQKGGYFGSMSEHRKMMEQLGIARGYEDVMHDYVAGAHRKIFLDRLMPQVRPFFDKTNPHYIKDDRLRLYAYDYIQAQRGTLGAKSRITFNAGLKELFPSKDESRLLTRVVDEVTRFQYITKIGISLRFPLVNMTQPILTTFPLVGSRAFVKGLSDAMKAETWAAADRLGIIYDPAVRRATTEFFGHHIRHKPIEKALEWATAPATYSEKWNRVVTFAAGVEKARMLGLRGKDAERFVLKLVDDTQFRYYREAMPLFMSRSVFGRMIMQFRTFTANYVNYLTKLVRERGTDPEGNAKLIRAVGSLMVLSGSSAFPMWDWTRSQLLRRAGVDIGRLNPLEWATEQMGLTPGINIGSSLEPFNFPYDMSQLLGPTIGPVAQFTFNVIRDPEELQRHLEWTARSIAPPIASYRRLGEKEARVKTPAHPEGKVIGKRPTLETLFLRPALESVRVRAIRNIADAIIGGRRDLVQKMIADARKAGVLVNDEFMARVQARVTKLRR